MNQTAPATTVRLFVAIDPSLENSAQLGETIASLRATAPRAKWTREEKLHVTLVFLGDIEETKLPLVMDAMRFVAANHGPFAIHFANGGTFGDKRLARVLWAGIGGHIRALCALQQDLADRLVRVGYTPEHRAYAPHVTLARSADARGDEQLALCADELDGRFMGETSIREMVLYRSETSEKGAVYTALFRVPLRA